MGFALDSVTPAIHLARRSLVSPKALTHVIVLFKPALLLYDITCFQIMIDEYAWSLTHPVLFRCWRLMLPMAIRKMAEIYLAPAILLSILAKPGQR